MISRRAIALVSVILVFGSAANLAAAGFYTSKVPAEQSPNYSKIVLVSWDGVRRFWVDQLMADGTLKNLAALKDRGSEISIRILGHLTVTDPGLANIETGYGPFITGVDQNYFGSSTKKSIPKGLTIPERLKAAFGGNWRTGLVMPWTQGPVDNPTITTNQDSTFWNARPAIDYWFSSENVSWKVPNDRIQFSFGSALLRADFVASKVGDFIRSNADKNFYVRTHWVEPDTIGHAYSESLEGKITTLYRQALIEVDAGLGVVMKAVDDAGIAKQTLILVTTDHGFIGLGHTGPPYPDGDPEVTNTWLVSSDPGIRNELGWALMDDIAPTILAVVGIDVKSLKPLYAETTRALPVWEATKSKRETTPPEILSVDYPKVVNANEKFTVTVRARDDSSIRTVRLWYAFGAIDFRSIELSTKDGSTFAGSVGPFSAGVTVRWFIQVIDNSVAYNSAYFPAQNQVSTFTVEGQPAQEEATRINPVVIGVAVVVLVAILGVSLAVRSKRKRNSA